MILLSGDYMEEQRLSIMVYEKLDITADMWTQPSNFRFLEKKSDKYSPFRQLCGILYENVGCVF